MNHCKRALAVLTSAALWCAPTAAVACATCMNDPVRKKTVPILMGFIGFPFVVAGVVYWALRHQSKK